MKEHLNDYEKRIWEGIDKDAEEIIKMVEADPEAMSVEPSEEMDRKIYAMIPGHEDADSEDSAMEGLSEEDQEALRLGRELQKRRKEKEEEKSRAKKRHRWKRITVAAAVLVLVIGIGGPKRIVEMVEQAVGDRQVSKVNNSKKSAKTIDNEAEEQAYQEIKDQLGFDPARIIVVDKEMIYEYSEIDTDMQMAQLLYKFGDANVSYIMSIPYYEELTGADLEDNITNKYDYKEGKLNAEVTEYELPESNKKEYSAKFEYKGVYYHIIGTIKKENFEEILKNLHFPS